MPPLSAMAVAVRSLVPDHVRMDSVRKVHLGES